MSRAFREAGALSLTHRPCGFGPHASCRAQLVKNLPAMQETWVRLLGWEDPLEKEMATHSSILAWRIHGQRSLAGYSPWGRRVRQLSN